MFITIKGEKDEKILINTLQIKFVVPRFFKGNELGSIVEFGSEVYIKSNSTVSEIERMIKESEDTE